MFQSRFLPILFLLIISCQSNTKKTDETDAVATDELEITTTDSIQKNIKLE